MRYSKPCPPSAALAALLLAGASIASSAATAAPIKSLPANDWQRLSDEGWQLLVPSGSSSQTPVAALAPAVKVAMPITVPVAPAPKPTALPAPMPGSTQTSTAASNASASSAVLAAASTTAKAPPSPIAVPADLAMFRLVAGESVQSQLEEWAGRAGWKVLWKVPDSWIVPGEKGYQADFGAAAAAVVEDLASNGADVLIDVWQDNKTVVIHQGGVQ